MIGLCDKAYRYLTYHLMGTLAARVFALFVLATVIPLGIADLQIRSDTGKARERAIDDAQTMARMTAGEVNNLLVDASSAEHLIEHLPNFWHNDDVERDQALAALTTAHPTLDTLLFVSPDLRVEGASSRQDLNSRLNWSRRAYLREAAVTGRLAVSDTVVTASDGQKAALAVAVPVSENDSGARSGFLIAQIKLDRIAELWGTVPRPVGSKVLLVDLRTGQVLAESDRDGPPVGRLVDSATLNAIRQSNHAFGTASIEGDDLLQVWQRVGDTPWVTVVDVPLHEILGPIYDEQLRRTLTSTLLAVTLFVLLLVLWRHLSRRLTILQAATNHWSRGDWAHRSGIQGSDEIGQLGQSFDRMASQLQTSTERNELILAAAGDGILGLDLNGTIAFLNPAAARMLGYSVAEIVGSSVHALLSPLYWESLTELPDVCSVARSEGVVHRGSDAVFVRKDGTSLPVEFVGAPIHENGAVVGAVVTFRDVTQRQAQERLKDEFISTVSHELRTPLSGVIGMTDLLLTTDLDWQQRQYAELLKCSSETLIAFVNDILDFSKIRAGKLLLEDVDLDVRQIVESVATIFVPQIQKKDLELTTSIADAVPRRLRGDPVRFRQVLTNLLGNAVKFTEIGAIAVRVGSLDETDDSALIRVEVIDTGIGIDPVAQELLFEPFSQANRSTARTHGGTGLGLAISKSLVELMGGDVGVASEMGYGSTFWFTARLAKGTPSSTESVDDSSLSPRRPSGRDLLTASTPVWELPLANSNSSRYLLGVPTERLALVVDDSRISQVVAGEMLRSLGYRVDVVGSGREALYALATTAYAVVLLDMHLPDVDGVRLIEQIRRAEGVSRHTSIVALTANAMIGDRERCLAAGVDDYLAKPFHFERLDATLRRLVTGGVASGTAIKHVDRLSSPDPRCTDDDLIVELEQHLRLLRDSDEPNAFSNLISLFLGETPQLLRCLEQACERGDADALWRQAHRLNSSVSFLGAREMQTICERLEQLGRQGTTVGAYPLIAALHRAFVGVTNALERLSRPASV